MRVFISDKYKSLVNEINQVLPKFTIISGVNGAGKSHLLKAIEEGAAKVYDDDGTLLTPIKYVNTNSLNPNDSYSVGRESYSNDINAIHYSIQNFIQQKRNNQNIALDDYYKTYNASYYPVVKSALEQTGKRIEELLQEDIKDVMPLYTNLVQDIFQQNFSAIFKRYSDIYDDNTYNEYLKNVKEKNKKFLTEESFLKKFGTPPWEFVNRIFEEANIGYSITDPIENDRDMQYFFKLVNKSNGALVNFSDLSSGEKVLMSLTLALYNTKLDIAFPKLLLLDEPDAPLHPSMAKQLLRVIEEVFVNEKSVKVIMTTHSPSTIAMAPEESLYVMQKESPRIQKKSKEQIMKLLTEGIPSLSIYADNTRQVFVESTTDVAFYGKIYMKLKKIIQSDKSLNFLSSGVSKGNTGNCEQVKEIVNLLTSNGNQTVYGIIDWDKKNNQEDKVHVLGWGQRYSIENYIFDPIILANFLIREVITTKEYFGLYESETSFDFVNFSKEKLQNIIDIIVTDISKNIVPSDDSRVIVDYLGKNNEGLSLSIPSWYLHHQGHSLEEIIKNTYPKLKKFSKLKEEVVDKVIGDIPAFISHDFLILLQNLHN